MSDDKIDKAIEKTVMDWLQWHTFGEHPDYAQHTLTLISRLKSERDAILKEADRLAEALYALCDDRFRGHVDRELTHYRNFKKGMKEI